jgi:uncharacterized paraquat-inducible protein A
MDIQTLITFFKSLFFHIWAGFPKSTQTEINYRLSICQSCEMYNKDNQSCMICGCNINNKKIFLNKLAWADQKCPIEKWKEIKR